MKTYDGKNTNWKDLITEADFIDDEDVFDKVNRINKKTKTNKGRYIVLIGFLALAVIAAWYIAGAVIAVFLVIILAALGLLSLLDTPLPDISLLEIEEYLYVNDIIFDPAYPLYIGHIYH